jgi:hypothetical protein
MTANENSFQYTDGIKKPRKKRRRTWIILGSIILLLIIARLVMPYFVLKYVNKTLSKSKSYPGHVEDIDIALLRGAYVIKDIRINKADSLTGKTDSIPFFTSPAIDLSVEWKALFKGAIVGEIEVDEPRVNFVKGKHKDENAKKDTAEFQNVIKGLMPLTINRFQINNGHIHYIDKNSNPKIDIALSDLQIIATNLTNANDSNKVLPAGLKATGNAYDGSLELNMKFDALQKKPTFDMNAKIANVNMVKLNDFFKAYGNFDVKKGNFGLYTEFAAKDGKFNGYVKPMLRDLDILQWNEEEGDLKQKLWEGVVATVAEVFKNRQKEQLATKVPISGRFDQPDVNLWEAIVYVLRNAFVYALKPSVDNTIDIGKVEEVDVDGKKNIFQRVFGKKDDDKNDKKNGKEENDKDDKNNKRDRKGKETRSTADDEKGKGNW